MLLLGYGLLSTVISLEIGILVVILGVGAILYSSFKKGETPTEMTVDKALMKREQVKADSAVVDPVEVERLYSELLTQYVHRWGAVSGTDILRSEISAYIRQGFSFPEAVKRIHARTNRPS